MANAPLNYENPNELVERYIGTAYDNVKLVAENITSVVSVSGITEDIEAVAAFIPSATILADNIDAIDTVASNITAVNTVATDIIDVNTVASNIGDVNILVDNIGDINTVQGNIGNIASVVSELNTINIVYANISSVIVTGDYIGNVNTVADNIVNVNAVANNINSVIGVNNNEANIIATANNLAAIQTAANIVSLTIIELTLTLDATTEITGAQYTSVYDAVEYAKTVMQVGGTLKLNLPANTTINEPSAILIENGRFNLEIQGGNKTTSIINNFSISIKHANLFMNFMTINTDSYFISNLGGRANISGIICTTTYLGAAYFGLSNSVTDMSQVDITFYRYGMDFDDDAKFNITGGSLTSTAASIAIHLRLTSACFGYIGGNQAFNYPVGVPGTGILAENNSRVVINSIAFDGNEGTQYNPPADTYGNYYSRIITVA